MVDQNQIVSRARPGPVHRLTFDYDRDQLRLVSDQIVNMISPPSHSLDESEPLAGFSVIVRDAAGRALYRFTRSSPIRDDVEVFSDDPFTSSVHRESVGERRGTFVMLVPHIEGAVSVELAGQPVDGSGRFSEARRLASFSLRQPQDLSLWAPPTARS